MRHINTSAILELIRRQGPVSRSYIAEALDLSLPTVMRVVDELIDQELVIIDGSRESGGGRPQSLVRFNDDGYLVIGVDLGGTRMYGALSNLGGDVLYEVTMEQGGTSGEESYQSLTRLIEQLLAAEPAQCRRLRGIGVGAPGITRHQTGVVRWAPGLNWRNFPLRERLMREFNYPVI